jgi:hypothetical protein
VAVGSQLDLDEIDARAEAATEGPWYHGGDKAVARQMFEPHELIVSPNYPLIEFEPSDQGVADAKFAAHARTDVPILVAEIKRLHAALASAMQGAARDYRQCIVSARATSDGGHYEKCNGRAEAYRQAATRLAELTGVAAPDWDQIRRDVPADGIYRHQAGSVTS